MNRMIGRLTGIMIVSLILISLINTGVAQNSDLTNAEKNELASKFAPNIYLHPDEMLFPVSPEYTISRSMLMNVNSGLIAENTSTAELAQLTDPDGGYYLDNKLGTIEDNGIMENFLQNWDNTPPMVHTRVTKQNYNGESVYAIQYYFYYVLNNGPINTHEGDWEMIMVVLDSFEKPMFTAYSQHRGGEYAEWALVNTTNDHPNVFVALGTHANYYQPNEDSAGIVTDNCSASGRLLSPMNYEILILDELDNLTTSQGWLAFAGCWGDYGSAASGIMGERGPLGPAYQGDRWDNPIAWAESLIEEDADSTNWVLIGVMGIALLATSLVIIFRKKNRVG